MHLLNESSVLATSLPCNYVSGTGIAVLRINENFCHCWFQWARYSRSTVRPASTRFNPLQPVFKPFNPLAKWRLVLTRSFILASNIDWAYHHPSHMPLGDVIPLVYFIHFKIHFMQRDGSSDHLHKSLSWFILYGEFE